MLRIWRDVLLSGVIGASAFAFLGTVTALWPNPFFIRMTPAAGFETAILAAQSLLTGLYLGVRRPACSPGWAGAGGVLGVLGVACPVCNKVLLLTFGAGLLLEYFEPVRIYVGLAGLAMIAYASWRKFGGGGCATPPPAAAGVALGAPSAGARAPA